MLIHLDLPDAALEAYGDEFMGLAVGELCRAHRKGHHIVSMSRRSAEWIAKHVQLARQDLAQLAILRNEFTQTGRLYTQAAIYIRISEKNVPVVQTGNAISVNIEFILKNEILSPAKLIVENIDNDGWVISFIMDQMKSAIGVPQIKVSPLHGGGVDVLRVLPQTISEKQIACLVIDTDSDAPSSPPSSKISKALKICEDTSWPFCFVYALPCRELENIVPLDILGKLNNGQSIQVFKILHEIHLAERSSSCDLEKKYILYFDLKLGLNEASLAKMNSAEQDWHRSKHVLSASVSNPPVIEGFGARIFEQIMGSGSLISELRSFIRNPHWRRCFASFFESLCWIFAASRRSFV